MDLVKARKKAKAAGKEELKDTAQTAVPVAPAGPAAPAQAPAPPAPPAPPEPASESKKPAKKAGPPPLPPREEPGPDDVFMDSAFGEDLPPMADFDTDEDDSMVIAAAPSRPPQPAEKSSAKSAARKDAAPAEDDTAWEAEFDRMQKAHEQEERQERQKQAEKPSAPARAAQPAPKPEPPKPAPDPKKKPIIPFKMEEDWAVAERRELGAARVEVDWEGQTPRSPARAEDDDFFSLVTEELYMNEFNRAAETEVGAQLELLSFRLGQETYAVRLTSIRQIIKLVPVTMVPRAPGYVLGILSLRGTIIPVFDLRRRLKLGTTEPTRKSRIIVVAEGKFMVGMIVDEVLHVVRLPEASLEPPPSMLAAVESEYIEGIGRTQNRMLILLALEKIMTPVNGSNR